MLAAYSGVPNEVCRYYLEILVHSTQMRFESLEVKSYPITTEQVLQRGMV